MFYLYKWTNLKPDSPQEQTRNSWLFKYGAFARKDGLWFPCKVMHYSTIGEPATITAIPIATTNMDIYPRGQILVDTCDVFYSPFANGMSIEAYIQNAMLRKRITDRMLNAALQRSLNTEIVTAPKNLIMALKRVLNRGDKAEVYIAEANLPDNIKVIELPKTIEIVEKLWNSNDWAMQEVSQALGISYNPAHGKKERALENELLGDRDLTIMNREMITSRLINASKNFGETVYHISSEIDNVDRNLPYGKPTQAEVD